MWTCSSCNAWLNLFTAVSLTARGALPADHGEGMGCDPSMPAVLLAVPVQGGPEPCSGVQEAQTCPAGSPATPGTGTAPGDDGNAVSPASPVEAARRTKRRRVGRPRKKRISEKDIERDIQVMAAAKWAAVDRRERYERRARRVAVAELSPDPGVVGGEGSSEDGVRLEGYVDPITLQVSPDSCSTLTAFSLPRRLLGRGFGCLVCRMYSQMLCVCSTHCRSAWTRERPRTGM